MTPKLLPPPERVKLTSELLMAFKRLLPFYEKNRPDYEIRKVRYEIRKHEEWLDDAKRALSLEIEGSVQKG